MSLTDAEREAITSAAYHALGTHRIQPHGDELHERLGSAVEAIVAARVKAAKVEALREAAGWIAEAIGYPIQVVMPDHPMPDALWAALVDHVHADSTGAWHGGELTREEVDAWLRTEANGPIPNKEDR